MASNEYVPNSPILLWPDGAPGAMGDGPEDRPRLTAVLPTSAEPTAAVVVCPGGGYSHRAVHEGLPVAQWLASLGVAGIVLDYRVRPYRHPIPLGDVKRAIRLVRSVAGPWNLDPQRVGVLGFSAGGHLAVSAATLFDAGDSAASDEVERLSSRPDCLIACYPVVSLGPCGHSGSKHCLLGPEPEAALVEQLSLENRVTPETPPTFLWHTSDDAAVPVENALLLAGALRRADVPFALHVYPRGRHGLGLDVDGTVGPQWTAACAAWLGEIGFVG